MGHGLVALTRGFFLAACVMTAPAGATTYLYVGNAASNEIVVHALDPNTGDLTVIEKYIVPGITKAGGSIPMAVSPDKKVLFAGFRGEPQVAASFAIDAATGRLKHLGNGPLAELDGLHRDRPQRQIPAQRVLSRPQGHGESDQPRAWCSHPGRSCRRRRTRMRSCPTIRTATCWCRASAATRSLHFKFDAGDRHAQRQRARPARR